MATGDKKISDLTAAQEVKDNDLLLMEQDGEAKNMSGAQLLAYLQPLLDESIGLLPKPVSIDFSMWDSGYITEALSDGNSVEYVITKDSNGIPTSIGGITISGVIKVD